MVIGGVYFVAKEPEPENGEDTEKVKLAEAK